MKKIKLYYLQGLEMIHLTWGHTAKSWGGREGERGGREREKAISQAWDSALLGSSVRPRVLWAHYLKHKSGNLKGREGGGESGSKGQLLKSTKISETKKPQWLPMCFFETVLCEVDASEIKGEVRLSCYKEKSHCQGLATPVCLP